MHNKENARPWLMRVAHNCIVDLIRTKVREREHAARCMPIEVATPNRSLDTHILLEESLNHLTPSQREIFVLRHVYDLSVRETARRVGCSEAAVRTADHRARMKVRSVCREADTTIGLAITASP